MSMAHRHTALASLGAAAVIGTHLILWSKSRRNRAGRTAAVHPPARLKEDVTRDVGAAATDRRPPEKEQVFSLYGGGEGDGEPSAPPIGLSQNVLALLESFDVDPVRGFLPRVDPLRRLPQPELQPWEAMADALPSLLAVGQARKPLEALPELAIHVLTCHRERMRALLLLSVFAHASVWGTPGKPQDSIPKGIAVPLAALAASEGMPPVLTHASLVLHNWHRLDPSGPVRTDNLACNCRFLGGLDETWFYIATVEIEARGGAVFGALLEAQHAIAEANSARGNGTTTSDDGSSSAGTRAAAAAAAARVVLQALAVTRAGIESMREGLSRMPVGCHPLIFYQRVRPFLSGWKTNPTLPDGVLYEGVSSKRQRYHGGSAAQSTLFPALDAALGVSHSAHPSHAFLLEMRDYMPPGHRRLLEHLADPACPNIRQFVQEFSLHEGEEGGGEEQRARSSLSEVNGGRLSRDNGDGEDDTTTTEKALRDGKALHNGGSPGNGGTATKNGGAGTGNARGNGSRSDGICVGVGGSGGGGRGDGSGADVDGGDRTAGSPTATALREAYNECLGALGDFRSTHLGIVGSYILQQQKKDHKAGDAKSREDFAGGKGTGGTPLLDFLKPLKNDSRAVLLEK
ncbi:unnamed protein product [Scytosiphon promiscuus]